MEPALEIKDILSQAVFSQEFMSNCTSGTGQTVKQDNFLLVSIFFEFVQMAAQEVHRNIPGFLDMALRKFLGRPYVDDMSTVAGFF